MSWLRRRTADELTVDVPAAPLTPSPEEHVLPGLAAILGHATASSTHRVLDLGGAGASNLDAYCSFATIIAIADLPRELGSTSAPDEAYRPLGETIDRILAGLAPADLTLTLAWDLLDFLDGNDTKRLVAWLTRCSRRGGTLHALISLGDMTPARPSRFELQADGRVRQHLASPFSRPGPRLSPAEVERRLRPFEVEHSVLLRHGIREVVAVLPA